jgi:outer membrane protein assembly factor BamA
MRKALPIALVCVSCIVLGQDQRSGWTDKNNGQMYAAYMLRTTYYERGYMSAQVDVKRSGEEDVFVVNPGPVFHFKDVKIVGLPEDLAQQVMKYAPKTGEVYSAARITDWLEQEEKRLPEASIVQKFAGEEAHLDRANATATVIVLFK